MSDWLRLVTESVSEQSWLVADTVAKGTICLVLVIALVAKLRRASAATRHLLWRFGFLALLAMPMLSCCLPRMNLLPAWRPNVTFVASNRALVESDTDTRGSAAAPQPEAITGLVEDLGAIDLSEEDQLAADQNQSAPVSTNEHSVATTERVVSSPMAALPLVVLVVWLAGAAVGITPALLGRLSLWNLGHRSRQVSSPRVAQALREATRELGIRRPIRLLESKHRTMPMTWGVLRPTILLPLDSLAWSTDRMRIVLLHELSHVKRWDCLWQSIARVVCVTYWFHPLVWLAAYRMRLERERACDDLVLSAGIRGSDYAEQLLDISTGCRRNVLSLCAGIAMANRSQLKDRVYAILNHTENRREPGRGSICCLFLLFAALMVPFAMLDWAQAVEQAGSDSEADAVAAVIARDAGPGGAGERDDSARIARPPFTWSAELPRYDTVDFSPDGKLLVAGSGFNREAGDIVVWDFATRREVFVFPDRFGVRAVKFSHDGKKLAAASFDKTIRLWDVATWKQTAVLRGHTVGADSVAFSPDGKLLASGGRDKLIKLWDLASSREIKTLAGHNHRVSFLEFSPDGRSLASSSEDKTARLWDVASGKTIHKLIGHFYSVEKIRFTPDGTHVATASWDGSLKLWNVASGKAVATLVGPRQSLLSVAFSPDGKTLLAGGAEGIIGAWDLQTHQLLRTTKAHSSRTYCIALHPQGKQFATAGWDRTVKLWDLQSLQQTAVLPRAGKNELPQPVAALAWSPDGQTVASADSDSATVVLRDARTGRVGLKLIGHEDVVTSIDFSPDGGTLATASHDFTVRLWDVTTGKQRTALTGHNNLVFSVTFSPDGKRLASAGYDRTVRIWEVSSARQVATLDGHRATVRAVAFSPDGKQLASAGSDRLVRIWDLETNKPLQSLKGHTSIVRSVAFSPDNGMLASGSEDNTIRLWDVSSGKTLRTLTDHTKRVTCLAFSSKGKTLASGGDDNLVRLWDPHTGQARATLGAHIDSISAVAFAPDGSQVLSGGQDGRFYLWKAKVEPKKSSVTLQDNDENLKCRLCIYSADGRILVTAGDDKSIKVWDAVTHKLLYKFGRERSTCGALSPDGRTLATGTYGDRVHLWDVDTGQPLGQIETGGGRSLSLSFSRDGSLLAVGHASKLVTVWDVLDRRKLWASKAQTLPITSVAFSPREILAAATGDVRQWSEPGRVKLWDVASGRELAELSGHTAAVRCVRFAPDGRTLATGGDDEKLLIWDVTSRQLRVTIPTRGRMGSLEFLPDGMSVTSGHFRSRVARWDVISGRLLAEYVSDAAKTSIFQISCSPDGSRISTACSDGAVRIWSTAAGISN